MAKIKTGTHPGHVAERNRRSPGTLIIFKVVVFFFFFRGGCSGLLLGPLKQRTYCCSSVQPLVGKGTLLRCKTSSPVQGIGILRKRV